MPVPDPRDAEIAALKAEVERLTGVITALEWQVSAMMGGRRVMNGDALLLEVAKKQQLRADAADDALAAHKRALAAGPAALRKRADEAADIGAYLDAAFDRKSADLVEDAQEAAMKEGT